MPTTPDETQAMPIVSAVIAVRNGERFIAEAVNSVLAQTLPDLECVVVDDGSTDDTAAVVQAIADPRVRLIRQENRGVSGARNVGISAATGRFVAFLDADDVWLPDKLRRQLALFERRPEVGLVYAAFRIVDEHLQERLTVPPDRHRQRDLRMLFLEGNGIGLSFGAVIPRAVLDEVGGFDETLSTSADLELACRIASRRPIDAVEEPLVLYRTHRGQMHLDLEAFERDMLAIYDRWFPPGDPATAGDRRRAVANLYTRLFFYELSRRRIGAAARAFVVAARTRPDRLVLLPASAVPRRIARRLQARVRRRAS